MLVSKCRFYCFFLLAFLRATNNGGEAATNLGCFIVQSILRVTPIPQDLPKQTLTPAACISSCEKKQIPYAGLENGNECYCGNQIPSLQSKTLPSECNIPCTGDTKEICGGTNRLNIYRVDSVQLDPTSVTSAIYIGCYKNELDGRDILKQYTIQNLTPRLCHEMCYKNGFMFFAPSENCTCTDKLLKMKYKVADTMCSKACTGDNTKICGGEGHISLYATGIVDLPVPFNYFLGCYNEQFATKITTSFELKLPDTISPRRCVNICNHREFPYASVRIHSCYCSHEVPKETALANYNECTLQKCASDETETCGSTDRIKVFTTSNPNADVKVNKDSYGCFAINNKNDLISDVQRTFSTEIIADDCSELCGLRGYAFAGAAKNDCFCEHNTPAALTRLNQLDCDSPCFKESPFPCGDRTPLSTFTTGLPIVDIPKSIYIGCFREAATQTNISTTRLLNGYFNYYRQLIPEICHRMCFKEGHLYFGVSDGNMCYCGDARPDSDSEVVSSECNVNCAGDVSYKCGGKLRTAIFSTGITDIPTLNRYVGCYEDIGVNSVLPSLKMELSRTISPRRCLNVCAVLGYQYAGVHSKRFCQCGNEKPSSTLVREGGSCAHFKCSGNPTVTCGGPDGITKVYRTNVLDTRVDGGYLGCFLDQPSNRLLPDVKEVFTESLVPNYCSSICSNRGFAYAGLLKGIECHCGHFSPSLISKVADSQCNSPCSGNRNVLCGGKQQLSIYYTGVQTMDIDASVYLGCFKEDSAVRSKSYFENRLLSEFFTAIDVTRDYCHLMCHREGFLYFGTTERIYCFCGDKTPTLRVKESECMQACKGDVNQKCGAESRFNIYHTGITDLDTVGQYLGCYKDVTGEEILKGFSTLLPMTNSPHRCSNICAAKAYTYFGLRYGRECRCGQENPSDTKLAPNSTECNIKKCQGDSKETCGAKKYIKIYRIKKPANALQCDPRYDNCGSGHPNPVTRHHIIEELTTATDVEEATQSISLSTSPPEKTCQVPLVKPGRSCSVRCEGRSDCNTAAPGSYVPTYTYLTCTCNVGYVLNSDSTEAYCVDSRWFPKIPECSRLCPAFKTVSVQLAGCSYNGFEVSCSEAARPGTVILVGCKPTYTAEDPSLVVRTITCLPDGNWDHPLPKCTPECGQGFPGTTPLLVGAKPTQPNDMPWHVAIYRKKDNGKVHQYICGGSIMAPVLVLSAAHCFYDREKRKRIAPSEYEVMIAKYTIDYNTPDDAQTKVFKVLQLYIPDNFDGEELYYLSDIAIIELDEAISVTSKVMPICIDWFPTDSKPPHTGKVAGWGLTETGQTSNVLLVAEMPFITQIECRSLVESWFRKYVSQPDKFCSGSKTGPGARQGDSGGGWIYRKGDHYFIYGIVSYKETKNTSVAVFTRISYHLDWMERVRKEVTLARNL